MRAAVLRAAGSPLILEERAVPVPRGEEVLVRVRAAGVCHTDLELVEDPDRAPLILGHEIAGEAAGIGPVLVHAAWGCGACVFCERGEETLCPRGEFAGFSRDGGYAEYVRVPSRRHLFPLGALDPVRSAVLADAGVTSYRAVRRMRDFLRLQGKEAPAVLVFGAGGLGQFAIQYFAILTHARVVVVEKDPAKRALARRLGADHALAPGGKLPRVQAALDIVGTEETLARGAEAIEPGGLLMLVGAGGGTLPYGLETLSSEIHLMTSLNGSLDDLAAVLELARRGKLKWDVEALPLERVNDALGRLRRGDVRGRLVLLP